MTPEQLHKLERRFFSNRIGGRCRTQRTAKKFISALKKMWAAQSEMWKRHPELLPRRTRGVWGFDPQAAEVPA